jgi:polyisoprenyl-teichoic acid--peptidoglycan teichoic acid transferase
MVSVDEGLRPASSVAACIGGVPETPAPPGSRRPRLALPLILGCVVVLVCSAAVSATFVLEQVHTLRDNLRHNHPLRLPSGALAPAGWGDAQTLLLVGDDQRSLTGAYKHYSQAVLPHSNEMLLVRIDPSKPYISLMSVPREMMVTIEPSGQAPIRTRFNYAYTAGGIPLLVSTIKRVLGVAVNHVMVITFARFERAVDQMGCVYSTVDRRYYHVNVPGSEQYEEINLQPGYQDMCGAQALQFVSYRHSDTSLVRDARDQSFLLDVRRQYGSTLPDNVARFERIFGQAVQTDPGLQSTSGLLNLIGTLISSSGRSVRQVPFHVDLTPSDPAALACECVTASARQISASVRAFLHGSTAIPRRGTEAAAHPAGAGRGAARRALTAIGAPGRAAARVAAQRLRFVYEYPRVQDRGGSAIPAYLRNYLIHTPGRVPYPIYVAAFSAGRLGQYYDVQGTTWTRAPLLRSPQRTVTIGHRSYGLTYSGPHLQVVTWSEHGAGYWVRNSLDDSIPNSELLAIAEQTQPLASSAATGSDAAGGSQGRRTAVAAGPGSPRASTSTQSTSLTQTLGLVGALAGLITLPVLSVVWRRRRRQIRRLRAQMNTGAQRRGDLIAALGVAVGEATPAAPREPWLAIAAEGVNRRWWRRG